MKRAKDKYMINRTKYKDIKRYDHKQVEDKKEIVMPLQNKEIGFGDQTLACPNCGQSAIVNPFRKDREIYPYCPWCGQKLKEAEDEQTE